MSRIHDKILVACIAAALTICSAVSADPPGRVGRLNLIEGGVSFQSGNMDEWGTAALNYPLTAGNSLWTDEASRAEVHVGSTAIRLGRRTEFSFLELDDQKVRISLSEGLLNVRLRQLDSDESFEVDTPTMSVSLLGPGSYRIEVRGSGETQAAVSEGEIEAVVAGLSYPIRAQQAAFVARAASPSLAISRAPAVDEWGRWCAERDRREDRLASVRYVPRAMVGCEDLDWYGSWSETPDYGPVWIPLSLPAGWAPYSFGHWAWVEPWGWTWIDNMPWGFAPFHYGRWALFHGIWVWVPGSIAYRPVYAPALVVFVEAGPGVPNGKIGWFPLGPGEVYVPPYHASRAYVQMVNIRHVRIGEQETIDASKIRYANREHPRAFTVASGQELSRVRASGTTAPAAPQDATRRMPQLRRAPKDQAHRIPQKRQKVWRKKKLPNGQWVWVEEWVEE